MKSLAAQILEKEYPREELIEDLMKIPQCFICTIPKHFSLFAIDRPDALDWFKQNHYSKMTIDAVEEYEAFSSDTFKYAIKSKIPTTSLFWLAKVGNESYYRLTHAGFDRAKEVREWAKSIIRKYDIKTPKEIDFIMTDE